MFARETWNRSALLRYLKLFFCHSRQETETSIRIPFGDDSIWLFFSFNFTLSFYFFFFFVSANRCSPLLLRFRLCRLSFFRFVFIPIRFVSNIHLPVCVCIRLFLTHWTSQSQDIERKKKFVLRFERDTRFTQFYFLFCLLTRFTISQNSHCENKNWWTRTMKMVCEWNGMIHLKSLLLSCSFIVLCVLFEFCNMDDYM